MTIGLSAVGLVPVGLSPTASISVVNVNCSSASIVLSGASAQIINDVVVSGYGASIVLVGEQAQISTGVNVNCEASSSILSGAFASISSGVSINCGIAGMIMSGGPAQVIYAIQSLPITNNTTQPLLGQAVSWSWFPGGRIGSFTGITPVEGTATTDGNGRCQTTATPGSGVLMVGVINGGGASSDGVYYEGF